MRLGRSPGLEPDYHRAAHRRLGRDVGDGAQLAMGLEEIDEDRGIGRNPASALCQEKRRHSDADGTDRFTRLWPGLRSNVAPRLTRLETRTSRSGLAVHVEQAAHGSLARAERDLGDGLIVVGIEH